MLSDAAAHLAGVGFPGHVLIHLMVLRAFRRTLQLSTIRLAHLNASYCAPCFLTWCNRAGNRPAAAGVLMHLMVLRAF